MGAKPATRLAVRQEEGNTRKPSESDDEGDEPIAPEYGEFTGFVFKTQANLDPKVSYGMLFTTNQFYTTVLVLIFQVLFVSFTA